MTEIPRSFRDEIRDVFGDVHEDFARSIFETDTELHSLLHNHVITLMSSGRPDGQIVDDIATTFVWMLLIGREHAIRGFPAPLPRQDDHEAISDDDLRDFIGDPNDWD